MKIPLGDLGAQLFVECNKSQQKYKAHRICINQGIKPRKKNDNNNSDNDNNNNNNNSNNASPSCSIDDFVDTFVQYHPKFTSINRIEKRLEAFHAIVPNPETNAFPRTQTDRYVEYGHPAHTINSL